MDCMCDQLFAGTCLSEHEHGRLGRCHPLDESESRLKRPATPDDSPKLAIPFRVAGVERGRNASPRGSALDLRIRPSHDPSGGIGWCGALRFRECDLQSRAAAYNLLIFTPTAGLVTGCKWIGSFQS
jgi:hypothetical protein